MSELEVDEFIILTEPELDHHDASKQRDDDSKDGARRRRETRADDVAWRKQQCGSSTDHHGPPSAEQRAGQHQRDRLQYPPCGGERVGAKERPGASDKRECERPSDQTWQWRQIPAPEPLDDQRSAMQQAPDNKAPA